MRLLLDTHTFIWWLSDAPQLSGNARQAIIDAEAVYVSAASAWEIAIKLAIGKLHFPTSVGDEVGREGFLPLAITFAHAERAGILPPHHADPFDRLLIAQAQLEDLVLISADAHMAAYDVAILRT